MVNGMRKVFDAINKLRFILSREQKFYCVVVFIMAAISAVLEILGVSMVIPLLSVIMSIDQIRGNVYVKPILEALHLSSDIQIIIFICTGVALIYIFKNAFAIFYTWVSTKFANKIRRELALRIFNAYVRQGYTYFVEHNSSEILRGIGVDPQSVQTIVFNIFILMIRIITVVCITVFIVLTSPWLALMLLIMIALSSLMSELLFKNRMRRSGIDQREYSQQARQASLEAIQGSKEIFAMNRQKYFTDEYLRCMVKYDRSCATAAVGSSAPNNILEAMCVVGLVSAIAIKAIASGGAGMQITEIAAFALGAFRILPYIGSILGSINTITYNAPGLVVAYETLRETHELEIRQPSVKNNEKYANAKLQEEIRLSNITFAYAVEKGNVLEGLDIIIKKGKSIGLIGASGAGKTTLSDLILGLYSPQSGKITMDGTDIEEIGDNWHRITGYVPQSVYLSDASIRRNVAFGIEEDKIDDDKVWKALEMAQLKPFVEELKEGLDTRVGEWGVKFSGGQRQRVAIARALYSDPDVLIMDEATAALDNETEKAVMESIEALQGLKTLVIVAHRLTTVKKCDEIYEIIGGKAVLKSKEEVFGNE
ncbi:ABC transporter ATP-binding protein [Lachnospiraceae bacterium OM04-12BH]|nr:ABC transporter ATP-binding protein [Lachnospiraceae bacterium OM04-12BH]